MKLTNENLKKMLIGLRYHTGKFPNDDWYYCGSAHLNTYHLRRLLVRFKSLQRKAKERGEK